MGNSAENSIVLVEIVEMYFKSLQLSGKIKFNSFLLKKYFFRKNGSKKYYG
tara:strand:- start:35 stop:187 length:153 start_codon:yes stop_codon:yes gene_type:complete